MILEREGRIEAIQIRVAGFSFAWLAVANLIGVWLAALLLWPKLGLVYEEIGYGRWMPLHMDWQLYGWCALPSLGLIAVRFWKHEVRAAEICGRAFWIWSLVLLVGGASWLMGEVTGKPFLNWSGYARSFLSIGLGMVWFMVAASWWRRMERRTVVWIVDGLIVATLAGVPIALFFVSSAKVYPPINPRSGGATGHSLLASTLGIVALMGVLPRWGLGLEQRKAESRLRMIAQVREYLFWLVFTVSIVVYLLIQHGSISNYEVDQIFGLGTLLVWPILVGWLWSGFEWPSATDGWRVMFIIWWTLLALTGWMTFLPGILEQIKFTNWMVAHAHLAMAGMVSAMNMLILAGIGGSQHVWSVVGNRSALLFWNLSLLVFVVVLMVQGFREGSDPGTLFLFDRVSVVTYWLRFAAGIAMFVSSLHWVIAIWRRRI